MSHHYDAFERLMQEAEQTVLRAGLSGGETHDSVSETTIMMATMSYAVRRIEQSNEKLIKEMCNGNGKGRIRRNAPAAGVGAAIAGSVMAVLAFLRDFFSG